METWPAAWCARLASGGRYVVRYDHRDTGASTTDPPGRPSYDGGALERDAAGLVRALDLAPAHLVGLFMGGGLAQTVALRRPGLVSGLTLVATSAVGGIGGLPGPTTARQQRFAEPPPDPDWSDRAAVIDWLVELERGFAGTLGLDEDEFRAGAASAFDRSRDIRSAGNHWQAMECDDEADDEVSSGEALDVHDIAVPTLVVHGTHDPLFPLPQGEALATAVPGARLLTVEGMGHQVPPRSAWDTVVPEVLALTSG